MKFCSTKNKNLKVDFKSALLTGMANDGGLFMPEIIPKFSSAEIENLKGKPFAEVGLAIAKKFIEKEIPNDDLRKIIEDAYDPKICPVKIHELDEKNLVLELWHGPTLAFKDFAARFMARCTAYFLTKENTNKTILVATSGDTGGAVGNGFLGLENISVVILYPKGGVSFVQEKQLTTMGQNVRAIEINGNFDDCQQLVKDAFVNEELNQQINLMSANSINIGRVIPQSFYYAWLSLQYPDAVYSVPSGNFGNLTGGLFAKRMGFPIKHFIASNNANHPFFDFLETGKFTPKPSVSTISNAMDIGHPNNYYRIWEMFKGDIGQVRAEIFGAWFDDKQTAEAICTVFAKNDYLICPHTAVSFLGAQKFMKHFPPETKIITVSTAHPAKFVETVSEIIKQEIPIPSALQVALKKEKQAILLDPTLENLKKYLLQK